MHLIRVYYGGKESYHVKGAAIRQIITNIISYTHADNFNLGNSQLTLCARVLLSDRPLRVWILKSLDFTQRFH